jgi:putative membrane protein
MACHDIFPSGIGAHRHSLRRRMLGVTKMALSAS